MVHLVSEGSPERAEPPEQEDRAESGVRGKEPESDLTSGITAAFNVFRTQLEQHFTVRAHLVTDLLIIDYCLINNSIITR